MGRFTEGQYWGGIGAVLGRYWGSIGAVLGRYWGGIGAVLGQYWGGMGGGVNGGVVYKDIGIWGGGGKEHNIILSVIL